MVVCGYFIAVAKRFFDTASIHFFSTSKSVKRINVLRNCFFVLSLALISVLSELSTDLQTVAFAVLIYTLNNDFFMLTEKSSKPQYGCDFASLKFNLHTLLPTDFTNTSYTVLTVIISFVLVAFLLII